MISIDYQDQASWLQGLLEIFQRLPSIFKPSCYTAHVNKIDLAGKMFKAVIYVINLKGEIGWERRRIVKGSRCDIKSMYESLSGGEK